MVTSAQLRAARGLLGWSVNELAERAGVHRNTIGNIEHDRREGEPDIVAAIRSALEAAGVEFLAAGRGKGDGVRLRTKS